MFNNFGSILAVSVIIFNLNNFAFGDIDFTFEDEVFAHVIKSTQKISKPIFHIKSPHCKYGSVKYTLYNNFGPFGINPTNGSVYLAYSLDPNGPNRYVFNVQAIDANSLCQATAEIQIYIVHINEHKPIMSAAKYHCKVFEDEQTVKVTPPIYATDKDEGPSGIIKAIHIREQGVPFKIDLEKDGRAKLLVDGDLDAESTMEYYFTIYAVDNGTRARKSERSKVYCEVGDVNEFSPVFRHKYYTATIHKGKSYQNIMQLEAIDRDISSKMGKVCSYAVVESNVPFDINQNGILSLRNPFSDDDPSYMEFQVKATDCGNMDSDEHAVVRVTIQDQPIKTTVPPQTEVPGCSPAVIVNSETSFKYPQCTKSIQLLPLAEVKHCEKDDDHEYSVTARLDSSSIGKGCERSHDSAISIYKQCGSKDVTDLLPTTNNGWVEDLIKEETVQGEANYIFDGNTASRLPKKVVGLNWENKFTLAAWLLVKSAPKAQFVLSWSDGRQFGKTYMGLYVINRGEPKQSRIGFIVNKDKGNCRFSEEWDIDLWDRKWFHVAVVIDKCNLQLLVNGEPIEPIGVEEVLKPEQAHIQPKYIIGGRWLGTHQKYTDFFKGKISQMVFIRNHVKNFKCILKCKESLDFKAAMVNGFQLETSFQEQTVYLTGRGSISSLQKMLRTLVYSNTEPYPTAGNRMIHIETTIDKAKLPAINVQVDTKKPAAPNILLIGKCEYSVKADAVLKHGFPICENIKIEVNGCLKKLEEALVTIDTDLMSPCNLSVSALLLKRFGLQSSSTANTLRITGPARISDFTDVLRRLKFMPKRSISQNAFDVKIEVSAQNGRFTSNALVIEIDNKKNSASSSAVDSSVIFLKTKIGSSIDNLSHGRLKTEQSKSHKSIIVFVVVSSFAIVSIVIGAVTVRYIRKSRENETVDIDMKPTELLWDDEGLGSINITMNPLIRFRPESMLSEETVNSYEGESSEASLYWSESEDENDSDDPDMKNALEWDSSYQEDFTEEFNDDLQMDEVTKSRNDNVVIHEQKSPCSFQKSVESEV